MFVSVILMVMLLGYVGTGLKDGAVHTFGRIVGGVAGFLVARSWSVGLSPLLAVIVPTAWARLATFLILLLLVTQAVGWVFHLAEGAFRLLSIIPFLKSINNLLGAAFGLIQGVLMIGGVLWTVIHFQVWQGVAPLVAGSFAARVMLAVFEKTIALAF